MSQLPVFTEYLETLYQKIYESPDILGWVPDRDMHTGAISFLQPDGSDPWYASPGWELDECPMNMDIGIQLEKADQYGNLVHMKMAYVITGDIEVDLDKYRGLMWEFFYNN